MDGVGSGSGSSGRCKPGFGHPVGKRLRAAALDSVEADTRHRHRGQCADCVSGHRTVSRVLPQPEAIALQLAQAVVGVLLVGLGSGIYLVANLGPGPRDGLMTGLARRTIFRLPG